MLAKVQESWPLKLGPTDCTEISVGNYWLGDNPVEISSCLLRGESLKSHKQLNTHIRLSVLEWTTKSRMEDRNILRIYLMRHDLLRTNKKMITFFSIFKKDNVLKDWFTHTHTHTHIYIYIGRKCDCAPRSSFYTHWQQSHVLHL
jgi:hypothetical protein